MKISCVRCGKKIDSPNVYCKECQKDMGMAIGSPPRSKRRWYTYLLMLLILCCIGAYFYMGNTDFFSKVSSLAEDVEHTAEELKQTVIGGEPEEKKESEPAVAPQQAVDISEEAPQERLPADSDTPAATTDAEINDAPTQAVSVPAEQTPAVAQSTTEQEVAEDVLADASYEEAIVPEAENSVAPSPEPEEAQAAADSSGDDVAETESASEADAAVAQKSEDVQQEPVAQVNELLQAGIIVFYLNNEGSDVRIQKKLQEAGYTNVVVKGKWPGAFNDQNVFYRHEEQPGAKEILAVLGADWCDYYYKGERISRTVKQLFKENDAIQFLIIPK